MRKWFLYPFFHCTHRMFTISCPQFGIYFSLLTGNTSTMTLKYFRKLSESTQYRRLLVKGVCVAERLSDEAQLLLFQLDKFYVEVAFHKDTDEAMSTKSFEDTDELEPYLRQIDLSGLLAS